MNIFVDTNALIYIAKSISGHDNVTGILNDVFNNGRDQLIVTDKVYEEATKKAKDGFSDAKDIKAWMDARGIQEQPTSFEDKPGKDLGEKSIAELVTSQPYIHQDYTVVSDDLVVKWKDLGVDPGKVIGVVEYMEKQLRTLRLSEDTYENIADGILTNNRDVPWKDDLLQGEPLKMVANVGEVTVRDTSSAAMSLDPQDSASFVVLPTSQQDQETNTQGQASAIKDGEYGLTPSLEDPQEKEKSEREKQELAAAAEARAVADQKAAELQQAQALADDRAENAAFIAKQGADKITGYENAIEVIKCYTDEYADSVPGLAESNQALCDSHQANIEILQAEVAAASTEAEAAKTAAEAARLAQQEAEAKAQETEAALKQEEARRQEEAEKAAQEQRAKEEAQQAEEAKKAEALAAEEAQKEEVKKPRPKATQHPIILNTHARKSLLHPASCRIKNELPFQKAA